MNGHQVVKCELISFTRKICALRGLFERGVFFIILSFTAPYQISTRYRGVDIKGVQNIWLYPSLSYPSPIMSAILNRKLNTDQL